MISVKYVEHSMQTIINSVQKIILCQSDMNTYSTLDLPVIVALRQLVDSVGHWILRSQELNPAVQS